ncbi:hypothetical protein BU24DRAFT_407160 [Aaosphaeria arxii CBS 175.79]|uniref:Uncharacterized protein n=1 Tax=Aaosphaeria arxii CBS 175.79 TaxID=1450172 RepID=A0A6A5XW73_9PLEO|nr:uncharacterized protein BU24DRAFT_407160 [Aaosphaeria arxii CBS 175.79]KAF2017087.1 hypothetical protein BU24DRAFT_407160 [Aaosphaeria arxii CBS 175.79]
MQIPKLIPLLFPLLLTPASALIGEHYACNDSLYGGPCETFATRLGVCANYPPGFSDKITSIKISKGQFCNFYDKLDCYGTALRVDHPGTANLRGKRFDNRARSWKCWEL